MKMKMLAAALLLGTAGLGHAADALVEEAVVVDGTYNWSGVYLGAQLGYAIGGSADYVYDVDFDYNYNNDPDGIFGGLYAGYNYQFSNGIVLGVEGDIAWGDINGSDVAPGDDSWSNSTSFDWTGSARVRLGYAVDRFLPYVTGGVDFGHLDFEETDGASFDSGDASLVGWTLGAGAEYAVTDNWIVRGEYRYTKFNDEDFLAQPGDFEYNVEADIHDLRIGAAYKF